MGKIKKILDTTTLNDEIECRNRLTLELCENIHLHYRDLRVELDSDTLKMFRDSFDEGVENLPKSYKHKENDFLKLSYKNLGDNNINKDKFSIELLLNDLVHIHYRNMRLELPVENFKLLCGSFSKAYNELILNNYIIEGEKTYEEKMINIDDINPYDTVHREDKNSKYGYVCWNDQDVLQHEDGIKICMELIKNGYILLPPSVIPIGKRDEKYSGPIKESHKYQRLDGFKRYMALKRLGHKNILCHVYEKAEPGNQRYKTLIVGQKNK